MFLDPESPAAYTREIFESDPHHPPPVPTRAVIQATLGQARSFRDRDHNPNLHIRLAPEMPCFLLFNQVEMLIHPYLTSAVGRATEVAIAMIGSSDYDNGIKHFDNYWNGRWVLFDLGNVLITFDHTGVSTELWKWFVKSGSISEVPTREAIHSFFFGEQSAGRESRNHQTERGQHLEPVWGEFCNWVHADDHFSGDTANFETFRRIWNSIFGRLDPRAIHCIRALQQMGISVGICSNTNESHWCHILDEYGDLTGAVNHSFLSFRAEHRKPDRGFFEWICMHTRVPACNHLLVDDLADNVAGARAAGMQAEVFIDFASVLKYVQTRFWNSRFQADIATATNGIGRSI